MVEAARLKLDCGRRQARGRQVAQGIRFHRLFGFAPTMFASTEVTVRQLISDLDAADDTLSDGVLSVCASAAKSVGPHATGLPNHECCDERNDETLVWWDRPQRVGTHHGLTC